MSRSPLSSDDAREKSSAGRSASFRRSLNSPVLVAGVFSLSLTATYFVWWDAGSALSTGIRLTIDFLLFGLGWLLLRDNERAQRLAGQRTLELSQKYALLNAIVKDTTDVVFVKDTDGRYVMINPAGAQFLGKHESEIIGHDDAAHYEPAIARAIAESDQQVLRERRTIQVEQTVPMRGEQRTLSCTKGPIYDADQELVGLFVVAREITESMLRSEELRKSEERSRSLIENASDAIFIHDDRGRILEANRRACESVGYTKEELLARNVHDIDPDLRDEAARDFWRRLVPGQIKVSQSRHRRKDGSVFPIEIRLSAYEFEGQRQILAIITDISQRQRTEAESARLQAQLQQAQKMEAIGRLAGGIAHDFNNILASILGYTALSREALGSDGDKRLASYLQQINRAGERARDLIAQMLTFSRARSSERSVVSVGREIREVIRLLTATLPSSIAIHTRIDEDAPPILINAVQLHQVIMNLCVNARDSMSGSGRIDIELFELHRVAQHCDSCHAAVKGDFVVLRVRDNGCGIPNAILPRIFEPFFTTKGVGKGSGLGLPVVHGIVHEHGGHIRVDNTLERGTAFELLFHGASEPSDSATASGSNPAIPAVEKGSGIVLVVDDELPLRQLMTELLTRQGYRVTTVGDGDEALRLIEQDQLAIDLVITDQTMPNMTGTELIHALRKLRPELQVILYSGYCDSELEDSVKGLGILAFMLKPVRLNELLSHVRTALSG